MSVISGYNFKLINKYSLRKRNTKIFKKILASNIFGHYKPIFSGNEPVRRYKKYISVPHFKATGCLLLLLSSEKANTLIFKNIFFIKIKCRYSLEILTKYSHR